VPQHTDPGFQDSEFDAGEQLFRRYSLSEISDGDVIAVCLEFPGMSFNRERYSDKPEDVLHADCCGGRNAVETGILVTTVAEVYDIPIEVAGDERRFVLKVSHEPEPTCLPHSEVWCCEDGSVERPPNVPNKVRRAFRAAVARELRVLLAAIS
jgi:hypothetical protein